MSILTQLSKLNITPDQLKYLTKTEIIRIEKRLKADVKFNENLTINEVEEVLYLLKNNKSELEFLYDDYFKLFRGIIERPNVLISFDIDTSTTLEYSEIFLEFISAYFEKELELYVINCNKEMHYYALYSLLNYKDILSEYLLDFILESLRGKINFALEILNLKSNGPFNRIDYISNPYFYRCITRIGSLAFEDEVIDLMNIVIQYNLFNEFYHKTLFALGEYKSSRSDISKVITDNRLVAVQSGVSERCYKPEEKHKKGGTVIGYDGNYTPNSSSHIRDFVWLIVFVVGILIGIYLISSNKTTDRVIERVLLESITFKDSALVSDKFSKIYDSISYFQGNEFKILKERPVNFDIEKTYFKNIPNCPKNFKFRISILNQSKNNIIVLIKTKEGCMVRFIPSERRCHVYQEIQGISLYFGKEPQIITCRTNKGEKIEGFRFKDWSSENRLIFNRYSYIIEIANLSQLIITNNEYKIDHLKWN